MGIPQEKLARILAAAVQAPSGDNAQPWRFQVTENTIFLLNIPERDTSPFNYKQASNHIALGACLENLSIAAENEGFKVEIEHFPKNSSEFVVAKIMCTEGNSTRNDLTQYLSKRTTNRRKYSSEKIKTEHLVTIQALVNGLSTRILFITDKKDIDVIASTVSVGEKIALENKDIHNFLFNHVTWNKEDDARRHGFYIKTFEFKPPQEIAFRLFKNWKILSFFRNFGVTNLIAKDMEDTYRSSGAFCAIILKNLSKENFLDAGIALERMWLAATKFGLSIQPTTAIPLLHLAIKDNASPLTNTHQLLVKEKYRILSEKFKIESGEEIVFAFRVGIADPPSGRTTRNEPVVEFQEN